MDPCSDFDSGLVAQSAGVHTLNFSFLNTDYRIEKEFDLGAAIIFPLIGLNERAEVIAQIKDPANEIMQFVSGEDLFDCFILSTNIIYTL